MQNESYTYFVVMRKLIETCFQLSFLIIPSYIYHFGESVIVNRVNRSSTCIAMSETHILPFANYGNQIKT